MSLSVATLPAFCAEDRGLVPPAWVDGLLGWGVPALSAETVAGEGFSLDIVQGGGLCLASLRVPDARELASPVLRETTARAYRALEAGLRGRGAVHPVRLWNHIPGIHGPMGDGLDRYMVFNAGRYEALSEWFGGREAFDTRVASASGVGHGGRDLVLHCLAAARPGRAVDNPRQVAPYRYSRRFGPLPPCFARATVIEPEAAPPLVLVGGTASIVGEESVHLGDLARQADETLTNLAVLLRAATGEVGGEADLAAGGRGAVLALYRDVRVYYPDPARLDELQRLLDGAFSGAEAVEWVRADLCRAELLVEIEGVADLPGTAGL